MVFLKELNSDNFFFSVAYISVDKQVDKPQLKITNFQKENQKSFNLSAQIRV